MARVGTALMAAMMVGLVGCQGSPAAEHDGASATMFVAAGGVTSFYTHAGAEQLYRAAKYKEAEAMCQQAIRAIEKAKGDKSWELAEPLNDLATVYLRQARWSDAKAAIDRAESVLDPTVPQQALILGRLGINKGWRLYSLGETPGATKAFEDARGLLEKNNKGESKDMAEIINNIGLMYEEEAEENDDDAQLAQARRMLLQGWQMRRKLTGEESPETGESLNNLGMFFLFNASGAEDVSLAVKTLEKALDVSKKVYGEENPETAMSRTNLAMAYILLDRYDDAEKELKLAMPVTLRVMGAKHPDRAYQLTSMGRILQEQTHYDEAEKAFTEAVAINEAVYGKNHPNVASSLKYLAGLYEAKGDEIKQKEVEKRIEKLSEKGI